MVPLQELHSECWCEQYKAIVTYSSDLIDLQCDGHSRDKHDCDGVENIHLHKPQHAAEQLEDVERVERLQRHHYMSYVTYCYVMSCYVTYCYVMSCYITYCYVMRCHTSRTVMS